MKEYLASTEFFNHENPLVRDTALNLTKGCILDADKAVKLFDYVRDSIPYNPYLRWTNPENLIASNIIVLGPNFCIPKAILLSTLARAVGIPSRIRFATIRNHQMAAKMVQFLGSDIIYGHGFSELYLNERWIKATPAFDSKMSEDMGYPVVEFNGMDDANFPQYDLDGKMLIEYIEYNESIADVDLDKMRKEFIKMYSNYDELEKILESMEKSIRQK